MLRNRTHRRRIFTITSLIPNMLTLLALCAGMTAIRFALMEEWRAAVAAGFIAAILDGLDGRVARLLKSTSKFGAELDSLSDFIAFGVAPAVVVYLWSASAYGNLGWIAALAYAACCGLRLARFNVMLEDPNRPAWTSNYFVGVAAPLGAALAGLPMVMSFLVGDEFFRQPWINVPWLLIVGLLMISHIPTYSFKRSGIKREFVVPALVLFAIGAAILISYPWYGMAIIAWGYLALMPFGYFSHRRLSKLSRDIRMEKDGLDIHYDRIEAEQDDENLEDENQRA